MPAARPLAIQSYCYRFFKTLPELAAQLQASGVSTTELCGVHADFGKPEQATQVVQTLKDHGIALSSIGVEYLKLDDAFDRARFEWCKAAGVKLMSISLPPEIFDDHFAGLKKVGQLADEYDLQLSIHNHGGYDWLGNTRILKYVFGHASPRIGLHLDTAWAIDAKQNPVEMVQTFGPRLFGVHLKDFVYNRERQSSDVIIGTGILDLPAFVAALKQVNFTGPLVIEYEADIENPAPKLSQCVKILEKMV